MKIPHSPRYCKSRFFAEREALANVTTREGTQGAKAPLQSGYFKRGMLNKLLSEGKKNEEIFNGFSSGRSYRDFRPLRSV